MYSQLFLVESKLGDGNPEGNGGEAIRSRKFSMLSGMEVPRGYMHRGENGKGNGQ